MVATSFPVLGVAWWQIGGALLAVLLLVVGWLIYRNTR